jgi:hypothetical protein
VLKKETKVFFVTWGNDETASNNARDTAVDALALAEQLESEKRPSLKIMDRSTGAPITLEELRGRATAEQAQQLGAAIV